MINLKSELLLPRVGVNYKTGFGLDDWIHYNLYIHTTRDYRNTALSLIDSLQFTATHVLGFSVFTSHILATELTTVSLSLHITHEVLLSQPNSFPAIILRLSFPKTRLNSITLLPSSYPGRLASRNSTLHF
jgi:hypothetical protein